MDSRARTAAVASGIVAVCCAPLVISVTAEASDDVLLSRNRPALASSELGTHAAADAVDGVAGTRWASLSGPGTQWLRVDLGAAQDVVRVRLVWGRDYARAYRVQVSPDGASWTDLYATRSARGHVDDLKRLAGTGRYLRVLATVSGTGAGFALAEVQAYGPGPAAPANAGTATAPPPIAGLFDPGRKQIALELLSGAENGTLDWRTRYGSIEDTGDGRGYTAGIVGFCSGTSDMLALVAEYTRREPHNRLARYLPALRTVDGSDSHAGLDPGFPAAWRSAALDPVFQKAQEDQRDIMYFRPAVTMAMGDGLRALGQFAYLDAAVVHGLSGLRAIRAAALRATPSPVLGGDETAYLSAFLDAQVDQAQGGVDGEQRALLRAGNLDLDTPLTWQADGQHQTLI